MPVKTRRRVYGLDAFALSLSGLSRLDARPVTFSVQLTGRTPSSLQRYRPRQREVLLRESLKRQLQRLTRRFPEAGFSSRGKRKASWTADGALPARRIRALAGRPEVQYVTVDSIKGRRKRRQRPSQHWYCVWGLVAIQIEGRVKGMVDVEDRLVLVKAHDPDDARDRLRREWSDYGKPYMNPYGYLVRWRLVGVRDVYEIMTDAIDPRGTEVYSRLRTERMKREYRWVPKRGGV